ncbi:hypothetical protein V6Z92_001165 [Aspergillus fumigatus]
MLPPPEGWFIAQPYLMSFDEGAIFGSPRDHLVRSDSIKPTMTMGLSHFVPFAFKRLPYHPHFVLLPPDT